MRACLTGGIACGKSLVASFLNGFGVETLDADDVVHELLPDPEERRRIAAEVFADPAKRRELEARLHPPVRRRLDGFLAEGGLRLVIVPLLFEVHWEPEYDIICAVVSSRGRQLSRMMSTRGYTRQEAESRLAAQLPVEVKAERSHYVIHNDGSREELKNETEKFVKWLKNSMCSPVR